jgi:hypothetical protein
VRVGVGCWRGGRGRERGGGSLDVDASHRARLEYGIAQSFDDAPFRGHLNGGWERRRQMHDGAIIKHEAGLAHVRPEHRVLMLVHHSPECVILTLLKHLPRYI